VAEGSKAKYLRDLLDKALETKLPTLSPEQFERAFMIKATPQEIAEFTFAEVMVRQLVLKACAGNDRSIQEIMDRLLGKPMQTTESISKSYTYHDFLIQCRDSPEEAPMERVASREPEKVIEPEFTARDVNTPDPLMDLEEDSIQELL